MINREMVERLPHITRPNAREIVLQSPDAIIMDDSVGLKVGRFGRSSKRALHIYVLAPTIIIREEVIPAVLRGDFKPTPWDPNKFPDFPFFLSPNSLAEDDPSRVVYITEERYKITHLEYQGSESLFRIESTGPLSIVPVDNITKEQLTLLMRQKRTRH